MIERDKRSNGESMDSILLGLAIRIRPIFGQFWNLESESGIRYFNNGFGLLIVRLKLAP